MGQIIRISKPLDLEALKYSTATKTQKENVVKNMRYKRYQNKSSQVEIYFKFFGLKCLIKRYFRLRLTYRADGFKTNCNITHDFHKGWISVLKIIK